MSLLCFTSLAYSYALVLKSGPCVKSRHFSNIFGPDRAVLGLLKHLNCSIYASFFLFVCYSLAHFYWPGKKLGPCVKSQTFWNIEILKNWARKKGKKLKIDRHNPSNKARALTLSPSKGAFWLVGSLAWPSQASDQSERSFWWPQSDWLRRQSQTRN